MTTVAKYQAEGSRAGDKPGSFSETASYKVTGLSSVADRDWHFVALNAPGIPPLGDNHPNAPGVQVISRSVMRKAGDVALVQVQYDKPSDANATPGQDPGTIEIGARVQPDVTVVDAFGNQITVTHTLRSTDDNGDTVETKDTQGVELDVQRPSLVIRYKRKEAGSPIALARTYVGTVNASAIWGFGPRDLLCSGIDGNSTDRGATYTVTYEFTVAPSGVLTAQPGVGTIAALGSFQLSGGGSGGGWDGQAVYLDKETNKPPPDIKADEGIQMYRVYREANFANMGLPDLG